MGTDMGVVKPSVLGHIMHGDNTWAIAWMAVKYPFRLQVVSPKFHHGARSCSFGIVVFIIGRCSLWWSKIVCSMLAMFDGCVVL